MLWCKKPSIVLFIPVMIFHLSVNAPMLKTAAADWDKPGYSLTFQDEFTGTTLDTSKWNNYHRIASPAGSAYINTGDVFAYNPNNVTVPGDGYCHIKNKKESITVNGTTVNYSTGMLQTQGKFWQIGGRFEARIKMPTTAGVIPAFWLMPNDSPTDFIDLGGACSEIDIMEHTSSMTNYISNNVHWGGYGASHKEWGFKQAFVTNPTDWHTYAVEWTPQDSANGVTGKYEFYVDGMLKNVYTGSAVSYGNQMIILSTALGSWGGTINDSALPSEMLVDWCRVYQKNSTATPFPMKDNFDSTSPLSGWIKSVPLYASITAVQDPSTTDYSIELRDNNNAGAVEMYKNFPDQSGVIDVSWKYKTNGVGTYNTMCIRNGTTTAIQLVDSSTAGGLSYRDSTLKDILICSLDANSWYNIRVVATPASNMFDIYINGTLMGSGLSFKNNAAKLNNIWFGTDSTRRYNMYINDVSVDSNNYLVNESFDNFTIGSTPTDWTSTVPSNTSFTIVAEPSTTNKSVRLTDNSTSARPEIYKSFTAQPGIVRVSWKYKTSTTCCYNTFCLRSGTQNAIFLTDSSTAGGLAYRNSSGTDVVICPQSADTWYTIEVVADSGTDTFDIYVDGILMLYKVPFRNSVSSIDNLWIATDSSRINTLTIDDIKIKKEY